MKKPAMKHIYTPELKSAVNAYLMSRAYAETMRDKVNAIYKDILTQCPVYADLRTPEGKQIGQGEQILDPEHLYLCSDDALVQDAWAEADKRERAAGIKPDSMQDEYCPALVAENLQRETERLLIEVSGKPFGMDNHKLLCAGLEKRQQWIDLVCQFVVSQPDFKNPLAA